jgi:hypothetical protein
MNYWKTKNHILNYFLVLIGYVSTPSRFSLYLINQVCQLYQEGRECGWPAQFQPTDQVHRPVNKQSQRANALDHRYRIR